MKEGGQRERESQEEERADFRRERGERRTERVEGKITYNLTSIKLIQKIDFILIILRDKDNQKHILSQKPFPQFPYLKTS